MYALRSVPAVCLPNQWSRCCWGRWWCRRCGMAPDSGPFVAAQMVKRDATLRKIRIVITDNVEDWYIYKNDVSMITLSNEPTENWKLFKPAAALKLVELRFMLYLSCGTKTLLFLLHPVIISSKETTGIYYKCCCSARKNRQDRWLPDESGMRCFLEVAFEVHPAEQKLLYY